MNFFLDLWHDLREKRLWPVAVGLLAAAIAIPVVMLKPAGDPVPPPAIVADTGDAETLPAVKVDGSPVHGSKLETFSTRNPFKPLNDLKNDKPADDGSGSGSGSGSDSSGSGSGSGGDSGSGPVSSPLGGGGPTGGGTGGSPTTTTTTVTKPMQWFHYTADVKFGEPTKQTTSKHLERLSGLPDNSTPEVMFMGVTDDGATAVFMVLDESLVADGEGTCRDDDCRVVELGVDDASNEESFTATDGSVQYDLELTKIRREKMDAPASSNKQSADDPGADSPSAKSVAGRAGTAVAGVANPSVLPGLLADADVAYGDQ
jgi:hypothetical protein